MEALSLRPGSGAKSRPTQGAGAETRPLAAGLPERLAGLSLVRAPHCPFLGLDKLFHPIPPCHQDPAGSGWLTGSRIT